MRVQRQVRRSPAAEPSYPFVSPADDLVERLLQQVGLVLQHELGRRPESGRQELLLR
jgi:hypothetical protein